MNQNRKNKRTEEPDNGQGNAVETGVIGQPTMKEKQRNEKTGETRTYRTTDHAGEDR